MNETETPETPKASRTDTRPRRPGGTEDVVRRLGLSGGAVLRKLVLSGRFPAPDASGIYDASMVDAWARANTSWLAAPTGPARRKIRVIWPAEGIEESMAEETEETEGMEETEELADEEALQDAQDAPEGAGEGLPLESIAAVREIALEAIRTIRELSGLAEQEEQEEEEQEEDAE